MSRHLAVMQGALERGEAGDLASEVRAVSEEGTGLVAALARYLHREIDRDHVDRKATKAWLREGADLAGRLVSSAGGPPWLPDDLATAHLAQSGQRARGVITDVRRDGLGNERVASLAVSVSIRSVAGSNMDLMRSLSVAVVQAPRVGDRVEVAYDASDPNRFVYRPVLAEPADDRDDRIGRLRDLADLFEQGLLTREEFDAEKARLLGQ